MMPHPDDFKSGAFEQAWGRDKIVPRALDDVERAFRDRLTLYVERLDAEKKLVMIDLANLPRQLEADCYADTVNNAVDAITSLIDATDLLRAAIRHLEAVPQREADAEEDARYGG